MFDFQNSGLTPELVTDRAEKNAFLLQEALDGFSSFDGSTGWVDIDSCADQALLQRISRKAAQIREEADLFILIGVGGSNNAARSVIEALRPASAPYFSYIRLRITRNAAPGSRVSKFFAIILTKTDFPSICSSTYSIEEGAVAFPA